MAGLFDDFFSPPSDPNGINSDYGLTNKQMYDARLNTLGSMGALLLAAGQPMMGPDRAKILAGLANIPGQQIQQMDTMSQAQLRSAQAKLAQQQLNMQKTIMQQLGITSPSAAPTGAPAAAPSAAAGVAAAGGAPASPSAPAAPTGGPSALNNMDPTARTLLMLGATSKPEEAAKALLDNARQQNEPTTFTVTDGKGRVRTIQTTKGQAAGEMERYKAAGFALGKPEYNEEQNTRLKALGELDTNIDTAASDAQELNKRLTQMDIARAGFTPGAGADKYYQAAAWLNSYLPGEFLPSSMSADKVANYQDFSKLATQYATEQARKLGAREAASVVQMMVNANPNPNMTDKAIGDIQAGLRAQNDYVIAKADEKQKYKDANGSLEGFENYWRKSAAPEQFLLKNMTPEQLSALPESVIKQLKAAVKDKTFQVQ